MSWISTKHIMQKHIMIATFTMGAKVVSCFEATSHDICLKTFVYELRSIDSIYRLPLKLYCDPQTQLA